MPIKKPKISLVLPAPIISHIPTTPTTNRTTLLTRFLPTECHFHLRSDRSIYLQSRNKTHRSQKTLTSFATRISETIRNIFAYLEQVSLKPRPCIIPILHHHHFPSHAQAHQLLRCTVVVVLSLLSERKKLHDTYAQIEQKILVRVIKMTLDVVPG